jgi:hypothetical protein
MHRSMRPLAFAAILAAVTLAGGALQASAATQASTTTQAVTQAATKASTQAATSICPDAETATFGPNVCVFTPSMTQDQIQADLNAISTQQVPVASQFDNQRYAIFFEPGTYGSKANPLVFQVGYYTEVAGLGAMPQDTVINGAVEVFNNLCTAGTSDCNADDNFWRSLSNVTLNVDLPTTTPNYAPPALDAYGAGCANSAEFWAASQAAPLRRDIINGSIVFQDYCAADNYASGGFLADSEVTGNVEFLGNQQYMLRNDSIGGVSGCPGGLWNDVYSGVVGAPSPVFTGQCDQNTVLAASPATEEEPFLYTGTDGSDSVFVPSVQHNTTGTSWSSGKEAGTSIPLSRFFIASPATPVGDINLALALGKNLVLTPGVYNLSQPIVASRPDTVILGQGFATLVPTHGNAALIAPSNVGVKVSGLIVDAGPVKSAVLVSVGTKALAGLDARLAATDPDLIQDVFFRIGGAETTPTAATVSLLDNAPSSIIDDVWAWRADHGNDVGWTENVGDTGLIVTGNDVTAYGLAVEHYQKSEVVWTGQNGTDVFFQNELPYDVPDQADWNQSSTELGYPAFEVGRNVKTFNGYAMGSYVVFIDTSATLNVSQAFESPDTPGVQFHNVFGVWIAGSGGLDSVVNGVGGPVTSTNPGTVEPVDVTSYP